MTTKIERPFVDKTSNDNPAATVERPVSTATVSAEWGSDVVADVLRALDLPYIALNPGASYRGLHDSLVNYLGNKSPQMLLALHEEHAVAIAHGYAKVTGQPMAVAVHSNVGLMHASMAIFNAWCDRVPMIILGATGLVDAAQRRPWIDWIHTSKESGCLGTTIYKVGRSASLPQGGGGISIARLPARLQYLGDLSISVWM